MLINFSLECVGTIVTSDKISRDGHEPTNLVSNDWQTRKKGFIAEHFIKPPVNITFEFPCSIQIYQVFVTPYVGQQLSSQVEIYTASKPKILNTNRNWKQKQAGQSEVTPPDIKINSLSNPTIPKHISGLVSTSTKTLPLFYQVSKVAVSDYGRICFTNNKFSLASESSGSCLPEDGSQCMFKNTMQHHRRELLSSASHVSVRLAYTQRGSSVAVSNIEIWGVPALSVPASLRSNIVAKYTAYLKPRQVASTAQHSGEDNVSNGFKSIDEGKVTDEELTIPEEFFDPLTCEIMSIPMLLPCGKNVDLSTLNRFFDSEANHGRAPRDPFTGVMFSENSKPISNIALKSRIDQFLFKFRNDKATASVARTVKGASETGLLRKRSCIGDHVVGKISKLVLPRSNEMKTPTRPDHTQGTSNSSNVAVISSTKEPKKPASSSTLYNNSCTSSAQVNSKSHEQELKESLNGALASILGGQSFKLTGESASLKNSIPAPAKCTICNNVQPESAVLYISPCNHIICRTCLTSQFQSSCTDIKCSICGSTSKRQDFTRKHHM